MHNRPTEWVFCLERLAHCVNMNATAKGNVLVEVLSEIQEMFILDKRVYNIFFASVLCYSSVFE